MNQYDRKAQAFLYFGFLLALAALDWWLYSQRFPGESFVLRLPFIRLVYVIWITVTVACFAASAVLFRKARKEQRTQRHGNRR